jgi:hypothetical protein
VPPVIAGGLSGLAALVVFGGLRLSGKSRRPRLFKAGAFVSALGLMLLWILPLWLFSADRGIWAMPMFIAALLAAASVLGLGLQLIGRACGAPEETAAGRQFDDFLGQNDLP